MARKWWKGSNAEASRKEWQGAFDLAEGDLSANLIALVCSAVSDSSSGVGLRVLAIECIDRYWSLSTRLGRPISLSRTVGSREMAS